MGLLHYAQNNLVKSSLTHEYLQWRRHPTLVFRTCSYNNQFVIYPESLLKVSIAEAEISLQWVAAKLEL